MRDFGVSFKTADEPRVFDESPGLAEGRITIGEFWESFGARTRFWSVSDYEASWAENMQKLDSGEDAFFLTDVGAGDTAGFFTCWTAFRVGHQVFFTQKLLLRKNARGESGIGKLVALAEKRLLRKIPTTSFGIGNVGEMIDFADLRRSVGSAVSFWTLPAGH